MKSYLLWMIAGWCLAAWLQARGDITAHQRTTTTAQYRVTYWTSEQGLPQNTVTCLRQTRDGYLWIGTRYGLVRYDGLRFAVFGDELSANQEEDLNILGLTEDSAGRLWVYSQNKLFQRREGHFQPHALDETNYPGIIQCVIPDRNGAGRWVFKPQVIFHEAHGRVDGSRLLKDFLFEGDRPECSFKEGFEDRQGRLWVLLKHAQEPLYWRRLDPVTGQIERLRDMLDPAIGEVDSLLEDSKGRLWMARANELLCWENGRLSRFPAEDQWSISSVRSLLLDQEENLWIGTEGTHQLYRFADGQFQRFDRSSGLTNPEDVRCLWPDREGNIWVGTGRGGLIRFQPRHLVSVLAGFPPAMDEVYSVAPGRDGKIWMATTYGLVRYQEGQMKIYTNAPAFSFNPLRSYNLKRIRPVFEDRQGDVWFGYDAGLLHKLQGEDLVGTDFPEVPETGHVRINSICQDRQGALWIGFRTGLIERKNSKYRFWTTRDGLTDDSVSGLLPDPKGGLWIGTKKGGLNYYQEGRFQALTTRDGLLSQTAWPLRVEEDGTLWVGTPQGLNRIRQGKVSTVTKQHGLYDNLAYCLLEDRRGNYWTFGNRGIWRVKKSELHAAADGRVSRVLCITYGEADGMASTEGNGDFYPNAAALPNGELWFPTTRGVVIVDPEKLPDNRVPPRVVIETVKAGKDTVFKDGGYPELAHECASAHPGDSVLHSGSGQTEWFVSPHDVRSPVRLGPGRARVLEISYTANTFMDSEKARFRVQLEGYDNDWVEADTRRLAIYTNLKPGSYCFRVQACNNHGYWSESPAEFAFILVPYFHQTWAFYALCAVSVASVAGCWHWWRLRANHRFHELERRQALENERNRLAKDLHDDVGASLTGLALKVEAARARQNCDGCMPGGLQGLAQSLRSVVDRMRELVWTINPQCDSLEEFASFLSDYAEKFLRAADLRCRLDIPADLPPFILAAETRHHLLLVAKEALNNAVKHAQAAEVRLSLQVDGQELILTIQDNGIGFSLDPEWLAGNSSCGDDLDPAPTVIGKRSGFGLRNMRKRLEGLGGKLNIDSQPGQGTKITALAPIFRNP